MLKFNYYTLLRLLSYSVQTLPFFMFCATENPSKQEKGEVQFWAAQTTIWGVIIDPGTSVLQTTEKSIRKEFSEVEQTSGLEKKLHCTFWRTCCVWLAVFAHVKPIPQNTLKCLSGSKNFCRALSGINGSCRTVQHTVVPNIFLFCHNVENSHHFFAFWHFRIWANI